MYILCLMNLLIFQSNEWLSPLSGNDPRVQHIKKILRAGEGEILDAGVIGGPIGKAVIRKIETDGSMSFSFQGEKSPPHPDPVTMIIGTPRPPTARRLMKDLTTAGVGRMIFCATDLGEKSYLTSSLWMKEEYKTALLEGISQGETTILPELVKLYSLFKAIDLIDENTDRLALDNMSPDVPLKSYLPEKGATCLAIGPERGWSDRERGMLRERGFQICSMGDRVLRTETACHMGLALIQGARGFI